MHQVLRLRADAAENAEDRLDEERRLDDAAIGEMREVVEMADIVALELEARAKVGQPRHRAFDLGEGVGHDEVLGHRQIFGLPGMLELGDPAARA